MNAVDLLIKGLQTTQNMVLMTLDDFTDTELMTRPTSGANHVAWQLGHLAVGEAGMVNGIRAEAVPAVPEAFAKRFTRETQGSDDPKTFGTKREMLDTFSRVRNDTIAFVKTLTDADLDAPGTPMLKAICPTAGESLLLQVFHTTMHLGQIQVARRRLGKKVLF